MSREQVPQSYKPKFWTEQRKLNVIGGTGIAVTLGVGAALGVDVYQHPGSSGGRASTGISTPSEGFQPTIGALSPVVPEAPRDQVETRLPHESVIEKSVCGPLLQAIRDRLTDPRMEIVPDGVIPERTVYTFTHETATQKLTLTTSAASHTDLDPKTVHWIQAVQEELGTGVANSDNPEGNTTLERVSCFTPSIDGVEHHEASGSTDRGQTIFNTAPSRYGESVVLTVESAQADLALADPAVRATERILAALPRVS